MTFILGYIPPTLPSKGASGERAGWARGGLSPIPPKIMCYFASGISNSREFNNDLHFHFRLPPSPARAPQVGGGRGLERV